MDRSIGHYFIGDIHGCYDSLRALEDRIARHAARHDLSPKIVSVGDLIDRGPASRAVVRHFRRGLAAGSHVAVPGNHDVLMLECLRVFGPWPVDLDWPAHLYTIEDYVARGYRAARWLSAEDYGNYRRMLWLSQGGYQTLTSYGCDPRRPESWAIDDDDLRFLLGLPSLWRNDDFVVTHALATTEDLAQVQGMHSGQDGATADPDAVKRACSNLIWNRKKPALSPDPARTHVSGHTPIARVKRDRRLRLVQIDTGCCFGRRLSAWCGETDEAFGVALRDTVDC